MTYEDILAEANKQPCFTVIPSSPKKERLRVIDADIGVMVQVNPFGGNIKFFEVFKFDEHGWRIIGTGEEYYNPVDLLRDLKERAFAKEAARRLGFAEGGRGDL